MKSNSSITHHSFTISLKRRELEQEHNLSNPRANKLKFLLGAIYMWGERDEHLIHFNLVVLLCLQYLFQLHTSSWLRTNLSNALSSIRSTPSHAQVQRHFNRESARRIQRYLCYFGWRIVGKQESDLHGSAPVQYDSQYFWMRRVDGLSRDNRVSKIVSELPFTTMRALAVGAVVSNK